MDLLKLLQGQLSEQVIGNLSQQHELPKQQTAQAATTIVSTLLTGLAQNASTPQGAAALNRALEKNHSGGALEQVMNSLMGARENPPVPEEGQPTQSRGLGDLLGGILGGGATSKATDGTGILGHILGAQQNGTIAKIAKALGIDQGKVLAMMLQLAPMIMAVLGKQKQVTGLNAGTLASILAGSMSNTSKSGGNPLMNMATSMLDKNGDGDIKDDLMDMGKNLLGGLFKKKK